MLPPNLCEKTLHTSLSQFAVSRRYYILHSTHLHIFSIFGILAVLVSWQLWQPPTFILRRFDDNRTDDNRTTTKDDRKTTKDDSDIWREGTDGEENYKDNCF